MNVLDLDMPRTNDRELLALIKGDDDLRSIPVVLRTTSAAPDGVAGAYDNDVDSYDNYANAYLTKPVSLDAFSDAVRRLDQFFLVTATLPRG